MRGGVVFDSSALKADFCQVLVPDVAKIPLARAQRQRSAATRVRARQNARFAQAESELVTLLPRTFAADECWHVISNGDIDALSYAKHVMAGARFDAILLSSWAVSMPAIEWLQVQFNAGAVRRIDAYVGEIMPRDRINQYSALTALVSAAGGRVMTLRTHAKIWVFLADDGRCVSVETSANANYNKRIEQACITAAPEVCGLFKRFLDGLDKPTPTFPGWAPYPWSEHGPPAAA